MGRLLQIGRIARIRIELEIVQAGFVGGIEQMDAAIFELGDAGGSNTSSQLSSSEGADVCANDLGADKLARGFTSRSRCRWSPTCN